MTKFKQYQTRDQATAAWLRAAKAGGRVTVLGGGWWATRYGRLQGLTALSKQLQAVGVLTRVPAREQRGGLWAWEIATE
jgi:hypothetical protein